MSLTAKEILRKEYGESTNFMTPKMLETGLLSPTVAYELSSGSGIEPGTMIYGVSVVHYDPETSETERAGNPESDCFPTLALARRHLDKLKRD